MAKNCPGCGAPMEYDPGFDSLVCTSCGNIIDPKDLPDADDFYHESEAPQDIADTLSEMEELTGEMYDCQVYKCSQCGGEIIISGTEISTRCIYCGSTAVVFSRIDKANRPDWIVPFSIEKETAIKNLSEKLNQGRFIPKAFKDISPECVRGIYIPYFTYDGTITDTQNHKVGFIEKTYIFDGEAEFTDLLVESCQAINDRYSALLEPYDMRKAVDFDTSYLMGFYSNIQDIPPRKAAGTAELKARMLFHTRMRELSPNSPFKDIHSMPKVKLQRTGYVLLPAWFITLNPNGTPYTFLVNGQTGKVVGTVPWNKVLFATLLIVSCLLTCGLFFLLWSTLGLHIARHASLEEALVFSDGGIIQYITAAIAVAACGVFAYSIRQLKRLLDKLKRSGSVITFIFSKKRQGGAR